MLGLLLLPRLATSDPPLPLHLCFTADRRSARAPPARMIYDQQLLLQPMTHTAGCQMWSPCKQKLIWQPNISWGTGQRERRGGRGKEERRPSGRKMEWQNVEKKRGNERKQMRAQVSKKVEKWPKGVKETSNPGSERNATCGSRRLIWMHQLSSALISAGVEKAKCLYYFISQLAARRLLSLCAYWPTVCGCSFIVWGALYERSITGEWLDYGVINALY